MGPLQVQEYWTIDPQSETVKIFQLHKGCYDAAQVLTTKQAKAAITTPLLPELSLPLQEIFSSLTNDLLAIQTRR